MIAPRPRPNNNHFGGRFKKMAAFDERANLVASYLLIITVLRRRREREAIDDKNTDFRYASKPNFSPIDFQPLNLT